MLKSLGISNFKAFGIKQNIELGNLTLFSGLNSSGKSSVYQALSILTHSIDKDISLKTSSGQIPKLVVNSPELTLGQESEIFNNTRKGVSFDLKYPEQTITFSYSIQRQGVNQKKLMLSHFRIEEELDNMSAQEPGAYFEANLNKNGTWKIEAQRCVQFALQNAFQKIEEMIQRRIKESDFQNKTSSANDLFEPKVIFENAQIDVTFAHQIYQFSVPSENIYNCIQPEFKPHLNFDDFKSFLMKTQRQDETFALVNTLFKPYSGSHISKDNVKILPPFRGFPQRVYAYNIASNPLAELIENEDLEVPFNYDFERKTASKCSLKKALEFWICDFFELAEELRISQQIEGYSSEVFLKVNGKWIPINNVGFGISQILPVVFEVLLLKQDSLLIIDEPEIHLHPSQQSKLAIFFFIMSILNKRIIIETHSDHLINNLIFLQLQHPNFSKINKLYWVNKTKKGAAVEEILYDKMGYIVNAPQGFLDEHSLLAEKLAKLRLKILSEDE